MTTLLTRAGLTLIIESGLACIFAIILGYLFWKSRNAAITLGSVTLLFNVLLLLMLLIAFDPSQLPFNDLDPRMTKFPDGFAPYLVHIYLILEIAVWTTAIAGTLGYFFDKGIGAFLLTGALSIAAVFCMLVSAASYYVFEIPNSTWALLVAVVLVGTIGIWVFTGTFLKGKGGALFAILWFEFFFTCWIGYQVAGRVGLLLITLPAQVIFWGLLYYFSILSLPIQGHKKIPTLHNLMPFDQALEKPAWSSLFPSDKDDMRIPMFRSVLTLNMRTNYPYYVIEDWKTQEMADKDKPDPRVAGNPFGQFFSGPGIVLNNCDHLAVISDGGEFKICPPGLSFTKQFELMYTDVDLRPQHRGMTIQAETKDGIGVNIFTFMPNRVWADGRKAELGRSYPFNEDAVVNAVYNHSVMEHKFDRDENQLATEEITRRPWHELVTTMGPPILKDVVAKYTCNELHMETSDPDIPKYKLTQKMQQDDTRIPEIAMLNRTDIPIGTKLQQYMTHRFDIDILKDLAFDIGASYTIFPYETDEELARALVEYCDDDEIRSYLAHQVQKRWPSNYLAWLFPNPSAYTPPAKIQVLVSTEQSKPVSTSDLKAALATQFNVTEDQITIIGAAKRILRFLISVPEQAVNLRTLSEIRPFDKGEYKIISLEAFENLPRTTQETWRYVCCTASPTVVNELIQPSITWDDALEKSRTRNPRVEIADAFIGKLKEEMEPLGIEVVGGGISDIKVPDNITAQRIKNWEVAREKDIEIAIAEAKARIALQEQEMRAEVRSELLTKLTQILQEADNRVNKQVLAIKLFEAMGIFAPPDTELPDDSAQEQEQNADCLPPYMLAFLNNARI